MFTIIQIIISVIVIYLIFSVIVYVIVEWISAVIQLRGKMLEKAILTMFDDKRGNRFPLGQMIYRHPQVDSLRRENNKPPSYIPSANIVAALLDLVSNKSGNDRSVKEKVNKVYEDYLEGIEKLEPSCLKTLLTSLAEQANNLESLKVTIEKWFNDSMDRVTGWYKKKIKIVILIVAAAVTISFNIDTIHIIHVARTDPEFRQRMNTLGDKLLADTAFQQSIASLPGSDNNYFEDYENDSSITSTDSAVLQSEDNPEVTDSAAFGLSPDRQELLQNMKKLVDENDLPVGWEITHNHSWLITALGWVLTVFALSMGAPFWFDLLKRMVNIRSTGPKPSIKTE